MEREHFSAPQLSPETPSRLSSAPVPLFAVPDSLAEFNELYGTEQACREALIHARWPDGWSCPRCNHTHHYELAGRTEIECAACGHQVSPTAGTFMEYTKLELRKLFLMLYLLVAEKDGVNCAQLSRQAGVNYNTARLWKLKVADMLHGRDKGALTGRVEVDETITGAGDSSRSERTRKRTAFPGERGTASRRGPELRAGDGRGPRPGLRARAPGGRGRRFRRHAQDGRAGASGRRGNRAHGRVERV